MSGHSGIIDVEGLQVLPVEGLWNAVLNVPAEEKLGVALEYAGCTFHDEDRKLVADPSVAIVGLGGVVLARAGEDAAAVEERLLRCVADSRILMASSAAFSYLNSGEKDLPELYEGVVGMGHLSVAHTVNMNFIFAGITEATELELSLQRDIVHLSKVTNARTKVQDSPPILVRDATQAQDIEELRQHTLQIVSRLRGDSLDQREFANGLFPINKATLLMVSGDVSNLKKLTDLRNDAGKERDFRDILDRLHGQLGILLPEIFNVREERIMSPEQGGGVKNDYFADELLAKLDQQGPVEAAYEAQDVSREVGFDFDDFQDVVPRALDEIRETKEAFEEEGEEGREHYGDEIADIMFSLTNLARHGGVTGLPTIEELAAIDDDRSDKAGDTLALIDSIGADIERVAIIERENPADFETNMMEMFETGFKKCITLSLEAGFDPITLLRENVRKYLVRCQAIETLAAQDGKQWSDLATNGEIIEYWKRAKTLLK